MDVLEREALDELLDKYGHARTLTAHPRTQAREIYWAMHGPIEFVRCPYEHDPTNDTERNGAVDGCYVCQGTYHVPKKWLFRDDMDYLTAKSRVRVSMTTGILAQPALFESAVISVIGESVKRDRSRP
jgi:hypothetical protein